MDRQSRPACLADTGDNVLTVFVDESGADGTNRFLVHGAMFVRDNELRHLRGALAEVFDNHPIKDEMKWTGINRAKLDRDMDAASCFFFHNDGSRWIAPGPRFQCLIVDQHQVDTRHFHSGDKDMCFYKFLYQLLIHRLKRFALPDESVHVVLDHRYTREYDLGELRRVLRNGLRQACTDTPPNVRSVSYCDSREDRLVQLTDLLTGSVCFHRNGYHRRNETSVAKIQAARRIARMAGVTTFDIHTRNSDQFGIWTFRLR